MVTIVLVGRPNTGKSTLFNRIVGGRVAITMREPGITRDRVIRTTEWLGRSFRIIDTGGLVPDSEDEINRQVERQVAIAVKEAGVVIMVVDGKTGIAPLDQEIALRLHKGGKQFLVVVNKLDIKRGFDPNEFHKLGGERIIPISAEHGIGVDELLDEIIRRLPAGSRETANQVITLAILGRPNVGKSLYLNTLLGNERAIVTNIPGTTRDVVEETFRFEGRNYRLLDTAGIRKKAKVNQSVEYYSVTRAIDVIRRCDVVLLIVDATEGPTNQDKKLVNLIESRNKGLVIVANKIDLVQSGLTQKVHEWVASELSFVKYAPIVFASALKNQGVTDAVHHASLVYETGGRRISNGLLKKTVLRQLQESPRNYKNKVLGLTQIGTRPPKFKLRITRPGAVEAAYKTFVISEIRRFYKFEGYPVRLWITR